MMQSGDAMTRTHDTRKWSATVTETSDALDLEKNVFAKASADSIARSLKRSAEASHRRKSSPFRSAMSMLTFYINRAGDNLPKRRRRTLEVAKDRLRAAFGKS
jgi:hypothetical protein